MKRGLFLLIVLCLMLQGVILRGYGAEGEISVRTVKKCQVSLYQVAVPEGCNYRLETRYGGGLLTFDDTLSSDLAAWLSQRAENGITQEMEQGIVRFSNLEEGLYLVVQTDAEETLEKFAPFLVCIPWDGSMWQVEVTPFPEEVPRTGDRFWLTLIVLLGSGTTLMSLGKKKVLTKYI